MALPGETLLSKMWSSLIDNGIGSLLRPWQIQREGKASTDVKVDEKLRIAQAEWYSKAILEGKATLQDTKAVKLLSIESVTIDLLDNSHTRDLSDNSIMQNITLTLAADEIRKEVNIAKAILIAKDELINDTQIPSQDPVNKDWLFRWRDNAREVSDGDLQILWGKILAGEIKSPGNISLRTLDCLRNISKKEAEDIVKLSPFIVAGFIYRNQELLNSLGISFDLLLSMQEIGVLSGVEALGLNTNFNSLEPQKYINYFVGTDKGLIVEHDDPFKKASFTVYKITSLGKELLNLCKANINKNYLCKFGFYFLRQGFTVKLASITNISGDKVNFSDIEILVLPKDSKEENDEQTN